MKNKLKLVLVAVVLAFCAGLSSCNFAHSCNGDAVVNASDWDDDNRPGGWFKAGFQLGPQIIPRQGSCPPRGYPQQRRTSYSPQRGYPQQRPYYGGGSQPYYGGGQQPYYGERISPPYPQGGMGGGYGSGVGNGVAGWLSGGGRTAPLVHFNEGQTGGRPNYNRQ